MRCIRNRTMRAGSAAHPCTPVRNDRRGSGGRTLAAITLCAGGLFGASLPSETAVAGGDSLVPPPTSLTVEFDQQGDVRVAGLAPGSTAVLLGAIHETQDFHARLSRVAEAATDTDRDGEVIFDLVDEKPAPLSVWLAADVDTGVSGMTTGSVEFLPGLLPAPTMVSSERGGTPDRLRFAERDAVEAMLVRVGAGSWSISGLDAGSGETSEIPDGDLELDVGEFSFLVGGNGTPGALVADDLVLAIDPRSLEWTIASLRANLEGGAP